MDIRVMKFRKQTMGALVALALCSLSLAGCVVYPSGYGYGYGGGGYYAPAVIAPPIYGSVIIGGGGGWGHGWGGGGWRR